MYALSLRRFIVSSLVKGLINLGRRNFRGILPTQHLRRKNLAPAFILAALFLLILPGLDTVWRIHYFLPPLVIAIYQRPLPTCLWFSLLAGLSMDIVSGSDKFGIYPLAYMAAIMVLYRFKSFFFADSWFTLPILTAIGSATATSALLFGLSVTEYSVSVTLQTVLYDCVLMSGIDALYAFVVFVLPAFALKQRSAEEYFA